MPFRARVLALPLGFLLAAALGACGSGGAKDGGATAPPLAATTQSAPATTAPTAATTQTATVPPASTQTTTVATQTTTQASGGAAPQTPTQPSGGAPAGCPGAVGGFIRDVRATDCGVAGRVANAWFAAVHRGAAPDSQIQAAGYSCGATMSGERANVACSGAGGGSVAFTASP